eukprot:6182982-Pleurochrysis_carterae.AAC.1
MQTGRETIGITIDRLQPNAVGARARGLGRACAMASGDRSGTLLASGRRRRPCEGGDPRDNLDQSFKVT